MSVHTPTVAPPVPASPAGQLQWNYRYVLLLLFLFAIALWGGIRFDLYRFNPITGESIISLLTPLFVIALFVERMLEVFVGSWKDIDRAPLQAAVDNAKKELAAALAAEDEAAKANALARLAAARMPLAAYQARTRRIAFMAGISAGLLIATVGVRAIRPLTDLDAEIAGPQGALFNFIDIVVTGGLIGGGSEGIHKLMSVITDFLDQTRNKINS